MKTWLIAAASSALLLIAFPALAGIILPPGDTGFTSPVCQGVSPVDALDTQFPFDFAANVDECKKLCGVQAAMCAKVAQVQAICELVIIKGEGQANKIDCADTENQGACKSAAKQSAQVFAGSVKAVLGEEKDICKDYKSQCETACEEA